MHLDSTSFPSNDASICQERAFGVVGCEVLFHAVVLFQFFSSFCCRARLYKIKEAHGMCTDFHPPCAVRVYFPRQCSRTVTSSSLFPASSNGSHRNVKLIKLRGGTLVLGTPQVMAYRHLPSKGERSPGKVWVRCRDWM